MSERPRPEQSQPEAPELVRAAREGDLERVRQLVSAGADVNEADASGATPLLMAVDKGHHAIAMALLAAGANPNIATHRRRMTPLHFAILRNSERMTRALLNAGAEASARNSDEISALVFALQRGYEEVARALIEAGADLQSRDKAGCTPLASALGYETMTQALLEAGADPNARNSWGRPDLLCATSLAQLEMWLSAGWDAPSIADTDGTTPLMYAISIGLSDVARRLIQCGVPIEARDAQGRTALWWASGLGFDEGVRLLLREGADREARDREGLTPLAVACRAGCPEAARLLLQAGADAEARDVQNRTPLIHAACVGHTFVMEALLQIGVNIHAPGPNGRPALSTMCEQAPRHTEGVRLLLSAGADANERDESGRTPLMHAIAASCIEPWPEEFAETIGFHRSRSQQHGACLATARALIKAGADPNARDGKGQTALSIVAAAERRGEDAGGMTRFLIEAGATE